MNVIKNNYVIFRILNDDEGILYDIKNSKTITINSVSIDIWKYIQKFKRGINIDSIVDYISLEYDISKSKIFTDIFKFVINLQKEGFIYFDKDIRNIQLLYDKYVIEDINTKNVNTIDDVFDFGTNYLKSVTFELLHRCNEKCIHCYIKSEENNSFHNELNVEKYKSIIDELYDMNCCEIIFTGGEPFLRTDFMDIFKYSRKKDFIVSIYTNGTLIDESKINDLIEYYPNKIYISLYGATSILHDSVTMVKGSFEKTIATIKKLIENKINVVVNFPIMNINVDNMEEVITLTKNLGVELRTTLNIFPKSNGDISPLEFRVSNKDHIFSYIHLMSKDILNKFNNEQLDIRQPICNAGVNSLGISPDGTVYPCLGLRYKIGNVNESSIKHIWNESTELNFIRNNISWSKSECKDCKHKKYCEYCIGGTYLETGKLLGKNQHNCMVSEFIYEYISNSQIK